MPERLEIIFFNRPTTGVITPNMCINKTANQFYPSVQEYSSLEAAQHTLEKLYLTCLYSLYATNLTHTSLFNILDNVFPLYNIYFQEDHKNVNTDLFFIDSFTG